MCFIVPSHIFTNILEHGTAKQKSFAASAISAINAFSSKLDKTLSSSNALIPYKEMEDEVVDREIYDAQHKTNLPGKLVRSEGGPSNGDIGADEAYDGAGLTYEFFQNNFDRNSLDNRGMKLISTVHYGRKFGNAFWDGKSMTYGDGDGEIFNRFTSVVDVIAHEMSHGVTQFTAKLVYRNQPGALNEHFSDVFGAMVKQYKLNHTVDKADWLIGEGLFTSKINGRALRDMAKPGTAYNDPRIGKDPQPDHMSKYIETSADAGGVHYNSGIPNRAFYLASMKLGGKSWEKTGKVWYKTLVSELKATSDFKHCAQATVKVAGSLFGANSIEQKAIKEAWCEIGLKI